MYEANEKELTVVSKIIQQPSSSLVICRSDQIYLVQDRIAKLSLAASADLIRRLFLCKLTAALSGTCFRENAYLVEVCSCDMSSIGAYKLFSIVFQLSEYLFRNGERLENRSLRSCCVYL